jgi:hypothetical protein
MRGARFTRKDRARRSRAVEGDVRCDHVPLTEVIEPVAIVSEAELERLRAQLTDSLRGGVDVFCNRAEALAGVRGRLTPRQSITRSPMRRTVVAP